MQFLTTGRRPRPFLGSPKGVPASQFLIRVHDSLGAPGAPQTPTSRRRGFPLATPQPLREGSSGVSRG